MSAASISEAESVVMQVLWDRGEATAEEIIAAVASGRDWQEATVRTLISRLLNKGAIEAEREGRRYRYRPLLDRQSWMAAESSQLIDRVFGGSVAPLVAHFGREGRLSREDLAEIRRLIEEFEHGR